MSTVSLTQGTPAVVVNAATDVGTDNSYPFAIPMKREGIQRSVEFHCAGTYTVCTVTLQQSIDSGTTWVDVGGAMDFFANLAGNLANLNAVVAFVAGILYQLSITSFTGTSITVTLAVS